MMKLPVIRVRPLSVDELEAIVTEGDELRLKPGEERHGYDGDPCNGNHSHRGPRKAWCPRSRALDRVWDNNSNRALYKWRWDVNQRGEAQTNAAQAMVDAFNKKYGGGFAPVPDYKPMDLGSGSVAERKRLLKARLDEIAQEHLGHS